MSIEHIRTSDGCVISLSGQGHLPCSEHPPIQTACDRCSQGVMDQDNPHYGARCTCSCHGEASWPFAWDHSKGAERQRAGSKPTDLKGTE